MLKVTTEELDHAVILHCAGRIVHGNETAILCPAVHYHGRDLILDLTEVSTIDAAGVGALLALQAAGIYLKLANPSKSVREILRVTQLESILEIVEPPQAESELTPETAPTGIPSLLAMGVVSVAV